MAAKSSNELIRDLQLETTRLVQRLDSLQDEIRRAELLEIRERLAVLESLIADLRKREEENDRRRWQFWLGVGVVVLTFVANLTIQLLMFFAKKPS